MAKLVSKYSIILQFVKLEMHMKWSKVKMPLTSYSESIVFFKSGFDPRHNLNNPGPPSCPYYHSKRLERFTKCKKSIRILKMKLKNPYRVESGTRIPDSGSRTIKPKTIHQYIFTILAMFTLKYITIREYKLALLILLT